MRIRDLGQGLPEVPRWRRSQRQVGCHVVFAQPIKVAHVHAASTRLPRHGLARGEADDDSGAVQIHLSTLRRARRGANAGYDRNIMARKKSAEQKTPKVRKRRW